MHESELCVNVYEFACVRVGYAGITQNFHCKASNVNRDIQVTMFICQVYQGFKMTSNDW